MKNYYIYSPFGRTSSWRIATHLADAINCDTMLSVNEAKTDVLKRSDNPMWTYAKKQYKPPMKDYPIIRSHTFKRLTSHQLIYTARKDLKAHTVSIMATSRTLQFIPEAVYIPKTSKKGLKASKKPTDAMVLNLDIYKKIASDIKEMNEFIINKYNPIVIYAEDSIEEIEAKLNITIDTKKDLLFKNPVDYRNTVLNYDDLP